MKPMVPRLSTVPKRTVLTVAAIGSPDAVFPQIMPSLYGSAYTTKFKVFKPKKRDMKIGHLVCLYPDAHRKPKKRWTIIAELEVPAFVTDKNVVQKQPALPVRVAKHPSGKYAEILHIGPYDQEGPAIELLRAFVRQQGLELAGPHEEVYLTRPGPKAKTIIRYPIQKA